MYPPFSPSFSFLTLRKKLNLQMFYTVVRWDFNFVCVCEWHRCGELIRKACVQLLLQGWEGALGEPNGKPFNERTDNSPTNEHI